MEYKIVGDMLMEGLDCYMPLVDDHGVDCVIKREDGVSSWVIAENNAASPSVTSFDLALICISMNTPSSRFITHELTPNFYFVFYSERLEKTWILSSKEFLDECVTNKKGKNIGKHGIWFNGNKKNKVTGIKEEYAFQKYDKYLVSDFSRFHAPSKNVI